MSYFERLKGDRLLFTHRVFLEEAERAEKIYRAPLLLQLNNPNNITGLQTDETLLRVIGKFPTAIRPEVLKVFGSEGLRLDLIEPILAKSAQRGHITDKTALHFRKAVVNNDLALFFEDMKVGIITSWGYENVAAVLLLLNPWEIIPADSVLLATALFKAANVFALPHFIKRAGSEIKYISQKEERALNKGLDYLCVGFSLVSNLIPFVSNAATPLMNLPRHFDFTRMLVRHGGSNTYDTYNGIVI